MDKCMMITPARREFLDVPGPKQNLPFFEKNGHTELTLSQPCPKLHQKQIIILSNSTAQSKGKND